MLNGMRRTHGVTIQREERMCSPRACTTPKWFGSQAFSVVSQESSGDTGAWQESGKCRRMISDILSTESGAYGDGSSSAFVSAADSSEAHAEAEKEAVTLAVNCEGGSLEDALQHLRERRITLDKSSVTRIALQICSDMLQLHKEDIAWGAVHPRHVALSQRVDDNGTFPHTGEARICEFCSPRRSDADDVNVEQDDDDASASRYLAPEALQPAELGDAWKRKAADVFSFGLLLSELLTSRRPSLQRPHLPARGGADFDGANCPLRRLADQCCAQDPLSRPTAPLLHRRLRVLSRDHAAGDAVLSPACPPQFDSAILPASISMQNELSTNVAASATAVVSERVAAQLPPLRGAAFDTVIDNRSWTQSGSDDTSPSAHGPLVAVSPLPTPEQRSPALRDGAAFAADMSADNLVHTRSASLSHVLRVQVGLGAISPDTDERPLPRTESARSRRAETFANTKVASTLYDEPIALAARPQPLVLSASCVESDAPAAAQLTSLATGSSHEPVDGAMGAAVDRNLLDEQCVSRDLGAEPESFSTTVTAQIIEGAPGDYPTSSMSSASFRRKSSKLRDILTEDHPDVHPEQNVQTQDTHQPSPVPAAQCYESNTKANDKHEREKKALDVIGASIAEGNYSAVLSTLKAHRKSHAVAVVSCTFLESICRDERLYFDFCEEGGIEEFISAILLFGKIDTALCTVVFNAISALSTHRDDRVSHRLRGMGVPSAVIDMLTYYRTDTAILTAGCECLALIARSSKQSQTAIATLGGPGIVYRAITQNNSSLRDVNLARASLKAVRYIAEKNERAADYLVEVAALDPVASVAELFTDDGLEQDILDALEAFSFYTNGRRSIIMSSGMNALATIMLRNREPRFLVQCCNFIRAVARWNDPECETAVLQSGIMERVVSLMEMSNNIVGAEGARLGWYACYACTFLASFGARSKQRLRRVGAVESTIVVFRRRMEDPKVVHIATDALAELMKNEPEARELAMASNIVGCLKEALIMHRGCSRVMKALQWTLEFLAAPDGALFGPAYGSQSHREMMRENSSRSHSSREGHKPQSWKSAFGLIRTPWKKNHG